MSTNEDRTSPTFTAVRSAGVLRKNERAIDKILRVLVIKTTVTEDDLEAVQNILDSNITIRRAGGSTEILSVASAFGRNDLFIRVYLAISPARVEPEALVMLTDPTRLRAVWDPSSWTGEVVAKSAAQNLVQIVYTSPSLSLAKAEALEEALQTRQRQLTPDAAALMGAGRVAYHHAGVGWRDEQSIVARAAARLLLNPHASRTASALADRILAGDGGGTEEQRKELASDFEKLDGGDSEPSRLADAALAAAPPAAELQADMVATGGRVPRWARWLPYLSRLGAIVRDIATDAWLKPGLLDCRTSIAVIDLGELMPFKTRVG